MVSYYGFFSNFQVYIYVFLFKRKISNFYATQNKIVSGWKQNFSRPKPVSSLSHNTALGLAQDWTSLVESTCGSRNDATGEETANKRKVRF